MILTVRIEGMSCAHCVRAVFTALAAVDGIRHADVSMGEARIEHDGNVTLEAVRDAVEVAGYTVGEATYDARRLPVI
jgi:P-type Cu+ transporter